MPEVRFKVLWPDGEVAVYYSPSTVIHQHFQPYTHYPLKEFLKRVLRALDQASQIVLETYGHYCTWTAGEKEKIRTKALQLRKNKIDGQVTVTDLLAG